MALSNLAGLRNRHHQKTVCFIFRDASCVCQNFVLSCIYILNVFLFFRIRSCRSSVALYGNVRCSVRPSVTGTLGSDILLTILFKQIKRGLHIIMFKYKLNLVIHTCYIADLYDYAHLILFVYNFVCKICTKITGLAVANL